MSERRTEAAAFIGFGEPPDHARVDSPRWADRIKALASDEHRNRWAVYGPYSSSSRAHNTASRLRQRAKGPLSLIPLPTYTALETRVDEAKLYVRVVDVPSSGENT